MAVVAPGRSGGVAAEPDDLSAGRASGLEPRLHRERVGAGFLRRHGRERTVIAGEVGGGRGSGLVLPGDTARSTVHGKVSGSCPVRSRRTTRLTERPVVDRAVIQHRLRVGGDGRGGRGDRDGRARDGVAVGVFRHYSIGVALAGRDRRVLEEKRRLAPPHGGAGRGRDGRRAAVATELVREVQVVTIPVGRDLDSNFTGVRGRGRRSPARRRDTGPLLRAGGRLGREAHQTLEAPVVHAPELSGHGDVVTGTRDGEAGLTQTTRVADGEVGVPRVGRGGGRSSPVLVDAVLAGRAAQGAPRVCGVGLDVAVLPDRLLGPEVHGVALVRVARGVDDLSG